VKTKKFPDIGFIRLPDIIGDKDNPGIIPISRSSWHKGIKEGRYPKPVKLGERASAWRIEDIRKLVDELCR
jgi:predicted DNA-binding transcriptional regulator AlpA